MGAYPMPATCRFPIANGSKIARVGSPPVSAFEADYPFNIYGSWLGQPTIGGGDIAVITVVEFAGQASFQRTGRWRCEELAAIAAVAREAINDGDIESPTLMAGGIEFLRGELRAIERVASELLEQLED